MGYLFITALLGFGDVRAEDVLERLWDATGIQVGGYVLAGATYNANHPGNGYNGPVPFTDRANRFQLNQLYLFAGRPVVAEGDTWDFGITADFMFGTDAVFHQAFGVPPFDINSGAPRDRSNFDLDLCCASTRTLGVAIPQAYVEAYVPVGSGLNVKVGRFYSPMGYEAGPSPELFFYSHAYSLIYGTTPTHVGALFTYNLNENWMLIGGPLTGSATGGWDGGFDKELGNWAGMAGFIWTSDDKRTSLTAIGTYGSTSTRSKEPFTIGSFVLEHRVTPRTHFVLHHVHGFAGGVLLGGVHQDAMWMGLQTHLYYDLLDNLSIGIRGDWFRDRDGFRVPSSLRIYSATNNQGVSYAGDASSVTFAPADYYAVTIGMNWKPLKQSKLDWESLRSFNVRPNIRYDRVAGIHEAYRPFDNSKDQWLFSLDFMVSF